MQKRRNQISGLFKVIYNRTEIYEKGRFVKIKAETAPKYVCPTSYVERTKSNENLILFGAIVLTVG